MRTLTVLMRRVFALALCAFVTAPAALAQTSASDTVTPSSHTASAIAPQAAGDEFWDDRFGLPGVAGEIKTVAVAPNGDVYVGGNFSKAGGIDAHNIARWDGQRWYALGNGLDHAPEQIAVSDTAVYVVGDFTTAGDVTANQIAQWDGVNWSPVGGGNGPETESYGSRNKGYLYSVAIGNDGLYVGGSFTFMDDVAANNIARWDGDSWSALGNGIGRLNYEKNFEPEGKVVTIVPSGNTLYVGGTFEIAGNTTVNSIATWNGGNWSALSSGLTKDETFQPYADVNTIAVSGNSIYVGGRFTKAGGKPANNIAQWTGSTWNALGQGLRPAQYASDMPVYALVVKGGTLYAAGSFKSAGGSTAIALLAQWNGSAWSTIGSGIADDGYDVAKALAIGPDGSLYAGGSYRIIGGKRSDNIAQWDGTNWTTFGQGITNDYGDTPGKSYAIAVDNEGLVYAGGEFKRAGGVSVSNLAVWDGSAWNDIGGTNARVRALAVAGDNLYVAGEFTQAGGISANHIARWNRTTGQWSALGNGINDTVYALAYSNGTLYVGGNFTAAGNLTAYDVAYWEGEQWHALDGGIRIYERSQEGGEIGTTVYALAVSGSNVYIGGNFQTVQDGTNTADLNSFTVVHNIVGWDRARSQWFQLGNPNLPGLTENGHDGVLSAIVNALTIVNGELYIGGKFNQAGPVSAGNIARWSPNEQFSALGSGVGGVNEPEVLSLSGIGTDLFVAGNFTAAGTAAARFVARFNTTNDTWSALGSGVKWYNDRFTEVSSIAASPTGVYISGDFDKAGELASSGFAAWGAPVQSTDITPAGGTITGGDGVSITFPAGAVGQNTTVSYLSQLGSSQPLPAGVAALRSFRFEATAADGTPVTTFAQPYTLRIPYTDAQLAAAGIVDPSTINVVYWNGNAWTPMLPCAGCSVDTANKVVTVVANHFTEFALVGQGRAGQGGYQVLLPVVVR